MERLECTSWEGGEMAVGALLRTWGAGGGCKPEMQLFGFFSRARSAGICVGWLCVLLGV